VSAEECFSPLNECPQPDPDVAECLGAIEEQLTQINTTLERIANAFERLLKSGLPV
jgi:hypothetical protein